MPSVARTIDPDAERLAAQLRHEVGRAIAEFGLIEDGDKVMVCLSGGKDSHAMLDLLLQLQRKAPLRFELVAVNLDQKQPGFPADVLPRYLDGVGVPYRILEQDTYSVVKRVLPEGSTLCSLCSRLRRGALYRFAAEQGFSKIALGHHRDDLVITFFMNLFHHARLGSMPPKRLSDDGQHLLIRPLIHCREADLAAYAELRGFPIIPCNLCGSQDNLQRTAIGRMLADWERETPGRIAQIARALANVRPSELADPALFDFAALARTRQNCPPDQPPCPTGEAVDAAGSSRQSAALPS